MPEPHDDLSPLDDCNARISADPGSAQALILYGVVKMLSVPEAGVFSLRKLREMSPDTRALVYRLMELYAREAYQTPAWHEAVARMDQAVHNRPRD